MTSLRLLLATAAVALALPVSTALAIPQNDARTTPDTIAANGQVVSGNTTTATKGNDDYGKPGTGTHSVWYRWTAPQNGMVTITNASSSFDPVVGAYAGDTTCCTWRADHDSGTGDDAMVSFYVRAGHVYEIVVDGENANEYGSFTLTVDFDSTPPEPANDDFANAASLGTGQSANVLVNNLFADEQIGEPNHRGVFTSHSVWYTWTPAKSGGTQVDLECGYGSAYYSADPVVAVYTGATMASLDEVTYTDADGSGTCPRDFAEFYAIAGVTYRIAVDAGPGIVAESGPFTLTQDTVVPTVSFPATSTFGPNQSVTFTPSENGTSKCRYDGGNAVSCNGQYKLTNAAGGNHKLEVQHTDAFGNAGAWHTKSFVVNIVAPDTQITGGPAEFTNKPTADLAFTSTKPGATFECRYTGNSNWFACQSGWEWKSYYSQAATVTFEVRSKDGYGNVDPSPATRTWTHDFKPPIFANVGASPQSLVGTPITYAWSVGEAATFACSIDDGPFAPCTSPHTVPGLDKVGPRYLKVRATDQAGNVTESSRYGYHASPQKTGTTTPATTSTSTTTGRTTPITGTAGRGLITLLRAGRTSITKRTLLQRGLRVAGACRPSCTFVVELRSGRRVLATAGGRASVTLRPSSRAAKKAVRALRKGATLTLVARAPGNTRTARVRVTG